MTLNTEEWMTVKQVAEKLKISRASVYEAIDRGEFVSTRAFDKTLVRKAEVDQYKPHNYMDRRSVTTAEKVTA